jgi:hypothetical protein
MNKMTVFAMFLAVALLAACAQVSPPAVSSNSAVQAGSRIHSPSSIIGKWSGGWSNGRAGGSLEIEISAVENERVIGQARFGTSNIPPCSYSWEKFRGTRNGGMVLAHVNLGGRCGRVDLSFGIEPGDANLILGTYSAEYPDTGEIRLSRR